MIGRAALVSVLVLAGCASERPGARAVDAPEPGAAQEPANAPEPVDAPELNPEPMAGEPLESETLMETPEPAPETSPPEWKELSEFVRVDRANHVVEIDGFVPIDCHDPDAPLVYLEVIACAVDSKEHESLVATRARPAHVHTALLLAGLEPGKPGSWSWEDETLTSTPPEGSGVDVRIVTHDTDGIQTSTPASDWVVNAETGESLTDHLRGLGEGAFWVFAGSRIVKHEGRGFYDADGVGVIVGLHTFGSEVVALREVMSPDSDVTEPEWVANGALVPEYGREVTVRLTPVE